VLRSKKFAFIVLCGALALPSAALAQGASDDQYVDPLAGLTGSGGGDAPKKKKSSSSSGETSSAAEATEIATEVTEATEAEVAKEKSDGAGRESVERPALDVNALSGIGPLVAVPVKHVTLVVGDIANERN
jgi:hypothetical protein